MKRDWQKAREISTALITLKDTVAKQDTANVHSGELRAILETTSLDTLTAQGELELAWLYYNQQRGTQLVAAPFKSHTSQEERLRLLTMLCGTRDLPKAPSGNQGLDRLKLAIELAILDDAMSDAPKWKAIAVEHEQAARKTTGIGDVPGRDESEQERELEILFNTKINCIFGMLKNHVEYWGQRPHVDDHVPDLEEVFWILSADPKTSMIELRRSWNEYERNRKLRIEHPLYTIHRFSTQEERDAALSRKWPDWCIGAVPETWENRGALETHIRRAITEDIAAERMAWERFRKEERNRKQLYLNQRPERIARHREQFVSKILDTFGQEALDLISEDDITAYSEGMADRSSSEPRLWKIVIDKYDFDQNTNSCLYFLRQGDRVKIGITSNVERRFAQIKTSAPQPCTIENVVYTHYGELLERKLHHALAEYNTHLEWFDLPPRIEELLFKAKNREDIERFLGQLAQGKSE